jgi:hypothetical protein
VKSDDLVDLLIFGGVALLALMILPKLIPQSNTASATANSVANAASSFLNKIGLGSSNLSVNPNAGSISPQNLSGSSGSSYSDLSSTSDVGTSEVGGLDLGSAAYSIE